MCGVQGMTTLTTIGFGDISPATNLEMYAATEQHPTIILVCFVW
jgi:hypothetical protein